MPKAGAENLDARLLRFRSDPDAEDARELAQALLDASRTSEALGVVSGVLERNPSDAPMLTLAGRAYVADGDLLRAQKVLLQAVRVSPEEPSGYRWLGEILMKRGDPERALQILERGAKLAPLDGDIRRMREKAERFVKMAERAAAPEPVAVAPVSAPEPEPEPEPAPAPESELITAQIPITESEPVTAQIPITESEPVTAPVPITVPAPAPEPITAPPPAPLAGPRLDDFQGFDDEATVVRDDLSDLATQLAAEQRAAVPATSPQAMPTPAVGIARPPSVVVEDDTEDRLTTEALPIDDRATFEPESQPIPDEAFRTSAGHEAPAEEYEEATSTPGVVKAPRVDDESTFREPEPEPAPVEPPAPAFAPPADPATLRMGGAVPPAKGAADIELSMRTTPGVQPAPVELRNPKAAPAGDFGGLASALEPEDEPDEPEAGTPPELPSDVAVGGETGEREDVDRVLRMLESQNIFEAPGAEKSGWATRKEIRKTGTSLGPTLAVLWVLSLGALGGAYYGYTRWLDYRETTAVALIEASNAKVLRGDHIDLIDAERNLRQAREHAPDDTSGQSLLLFVHCQRALEDGAFQAGYLHATIARAERMHASPPRVAAAEAVIAASRGLNEEALQHATAALTADSEDPAVLYVVGRVRQRLGDEAGLENLREALVQEPNLNAAALALSEVEARSGDRAAALASVDALLERHADHLRAGLWKAYLTAEDVEPEAGLAALAPLQARLEHGAPTDAVLAHLALGRLLRRTGDVEAATEAVVQAARDGVTEPRLLALVATESHAAGRLSQAEALAQRAVEGAPNSPEYRKTLARILIARHRGSRALTALAPLSSEDAEVLSLSAQAALLVGSTEAMDAAAGALDGYIDAHGDASVGLRALAIRIQVRRGNGAAALRRAERLARRNDGDPEAGLALAEAALAARDAEIALEATERLVAATPDSADAQFLHGRAERMAGRSEEAETALRRAVELSPGFTDAEIVLGYLLLDTGKFEEAEALYGGLSRRRLQVGASAAMVGHLGRAEALLGLGRVDEARVEYLSLPEEARQTTSARVVEARLAIAERQAAQAVSILRPLAEAEGATVDLIVLYGDALFAARETEAASGVYESAVRADSTNPEALLGYAEILILGEKWDEALAIVGRAESALETRIRAPSVHGRMFMVRGVAAMGRGDVDAAREALRQATAQAGTPPEAWFHLGESLASANSPESRAAYERYLELAPRGYYASRARRAIR